MYTFKSKWSVVIYQMTCKVHVKVNGDRRKSVP